MHDEGVERCKTSDLRCVSSENAWHNAGIVDEKMEVAAGASASACVFFVNKMDKRDSRESKYQHGDRLGSRQSP